MVAPAGVRASGPCPLASSLLPGHIPGLPKPKGQARLGGVTVTTRSVRNAAIIIGVVFVLAFALAALIRQHGDGPLGGLPDWLGTAAYVTWWISALLLILVGLAAIALRVRRGRPDHRTSAPS